MDEISNSALLERKKAEVEKLTFDEIRSWPFSHSFFCLYHGVPLLLKSRSAQLSTELSALLPESWRKTPLKEALTVYVVDPTELGFTHEEWCAESSQDCLSYNENTVAIQRDFAAKKSDESVLLICESKVSDGFYNFLRWFISEKLLEQNKFVMHSSCVLDKNGRAHLFLGHSEAGKTTITELSHPRLVLGDDMNIVSSEMGKLMVEAGAIGGRFHSMIGYDKKVPVAACYWLRQKPKNHLAELDKTQAAQKFIASFANLNWPTLTVEKNFKLIQFASEACASVPFYTLEFEKSSSVWEMLDP